MSQKNQKIRDKADYLLLHVSSLLSIIFIFFQILIGGIKALILFFPLIILIVILPMYIGYIRGVILCDSIIERIRGWIFLLMGSGFYSYILVLYFIGEYIEFPYYNMMHLIGGAIIGFIGFRYIATFSQKVNEIYGGKCLTQLDHIIIKRTSFSIIGLNLSLSIITTSLHEAVYNFDFYSAILFFCIPLIIIFFYSEYINRYEIFFNKNYSKTKNKNVIMVIAFLFVLISTIVCVIVLILIQNSDIETVSINLTFGINITILFLIFIYYD